MLFPYIVVTCCRENKPTMDQPRFPQSSPQGYPNNQQGQWPQQHQQPMPGLEHPQPQGPQVPPPLISLQTPMLDAMYRQTPQQSGLPTQPMPHQQVQPGPGQFSVPPTNQERMFPGPQHIVPPPQVVPPGLVHQAQQAHPSTPASVGGAAGQYYHPLQQQPPQAASLNAHHPMHGGSAGVPPLQPGPYGPPMNPGHPSGLSQHPPQQGSPQIVPPNAQQPMQEAPPMAPPAGARPPSEGPVVTEIRQPTPLTNNGQRNAGNEEAHPQIEAVRERLWDLHTKEVMEVTEELQWRELPDAETALRESLKEYVAKTMGEFAKNRDRVRAAVAENIVQGGGSHQGAASAAPRAKHSPSVSRASSPDNPASNDLPGPSRDVPNHSDNRRARSPTASNMSDGEAGSIAVAEPLATRNVDIERSMSPTGSSSRSRRHSQRGDAASNAGSSRPRGGTGRWHSTGMYYASGRHHGGTPGDAHIRFKHRSFQR